MRRSLGTLAGRAALAALLASRAAAEGAPEALTPCLTPQDTLGAYVAAFEAEGWARADVLASGGPASRLAEFWLAFMFQPATAEDFDDLMLRARDPGRVFGSDWLGPTENLALLTRGEAAAMVEWDVAGDGEGHFTRCYVAAPNLPEVDVRLPSNATTGGTVQVVFEDPSPPSGVALLGVGAARLVPPPGVEARSHVEALIVAIEMERTE